MTVSPILTTAGLSMLIRAISGETITFTKFKAGDGAAPDNPAALTDLVSPVLQFGISAVDTSDAGYIQITGSFDNTDVQTDFSWRELGLYCKDEDENEILYAYSNDGDAAGIITASGGDILTEQQVTMIVAIGEAEHVTAVISASALYAAKSDFDAHVANTSNPHGVTKAQVGLDNVPNVATNDQTPTYTIAANLTELTSGEKLGTALGKLARAVRRLIDHLTSTNNPHSVTRAQLGAAAASHTHSAADIYSGTLAVARGGTGRNAKTTNSTDYEFRAIKLQDTVPEIVDAGCIVLVYESE